ncbi:glutaredoxin 3 [Gluconobacter wancherniae]|uniref:Glutaredoxin n=1 Tax=Gluconobacter wancherniae NBRC 103581 TaxID=656744 RepID=A0A511B1U6_9PROT|nr:glutaredoxin 3 [Gluconobacter wancherniae]MBF0853599.1 glutaredoxin 3 [Gluconobacter wancherniae]MBS1063178.1 glutaredoxin 3 [Gluconobacter wancherniae]MBS1089021.1 glutaredoxin 3 [Gluconobacter wancherniae]MBS1094089.1 glutaredoxin 3 [Gluconobacter wancherniae]GBD55655.1 glutaredoxin [Gluconobacter wancherniae NBRC 103581]
MKKIEIYTQPGCPYCVHAVALLRSKNISFEEINAPHGTPERTTSIERSGSRTVPQVFVDGVGLGGCDDIVALNRAGKLDALLGVV